MRPTELSGFFPGGFHQWGAPQNGWWEKTNFSMDFLWGSSPFMEPPICIHPNFQALLSHVIMELVDFRHGAVRAPSQIEMTCCWIKGRRKLEFWGTRRSRHLPVFFPGTIVVYNIWIVEAYNESFRVFMGNSWPTFSDISTFLLFLNETYRSLFACFLRTLMQLGPYCMWSANGVGKPKSPPCRGAVKIRQWHLS